MEAVVNSYRPKNKKWQTRLAVFPQTYYVL